MDLMSLKFDQGSYATREQEMFLPGVIPFHSDNFYKKTSWSVANDVFLPTLSHWVQT